MNMKKAFAGVLASVVAISAMATTMVSAKNELTFTKDQEAFSKTWDFTATKYKVTWEGKTNYAYKIPTATTTMVATATTLGAGNTVSFSSTNSTAVGFAFVLDGAAGTETVTLAPANVGGVAMNVYTVHGAAASTDVQVAAALNAYKAAAASTDAIKNITITSTATGAFNGGAALAAAAVAAGLPFTTPAVAGGIDAAIPGSTASSVLMVEFFETTNGLKDDGVTSSSAAVDSAKLKIDGFKYLSTVDTAGNRNTSPVSMTYDLRKIKDTNKWYIWNVTGGTNTSLGSIDIGATFDAYITNYELSYTTSDSKTKKTEADDLAKTEKKYYANIWQRAADITTGEPNQAAAPATVNASWTQVFNSFDAVTAGIGGVGSGNVIVTPKGTTGSSEVVHGVTFTGLNASTYKTTTDKYIGAVTKQDTIYYLGNPNAQDQNARNDYNIVMWDGKSSYIHSFKEEMTSETPLAKEADAKNAIAAAAKRNDDIKNVAWNSMLKEVQSLIGDAKGATVSFGVYTATTTDAGRGNDTFNRETDAPLVSGATAQDFGLAVNTQSSNKFYSAANMKDNKITLSWDEITQGLAAGTIIDGAIRIGAGKKFVIDSLTVDVPAKKLADLSAGEAAEETTVALETTAAPAADTTAAAANPTTGNAPIALAVIPVAIIAAAVVAKKRG